MIKQRTIQTVNRTVGVGLHSGQRVEMTLHPAPAGTGIVFRRVDIPGSQEIPVATEVVTDTRMASTISSRDATVQTVEHLMSACAGLGIDNLRVDLSAAEVPILDGSASSFVFLLQTAGIVEQEALRQFVRITHPIEVREGSGKNLKWAKLEPYHGYRLSFEIVFDHQVVSNTGQTVSFDWGTGSYNQDVGRARTFVPSKDVEALRANGLALGGSLDNAIVMDDERVLNHGGLRYGDEFVKHKLLDAMGDLYLLGKPLLANYSAFRSGHALNNQLLRALQDQPEHWEVVTFPDAAKAPVGFDQMPKAW